MRRADPTRFRGSRYNPARFRRRRSARASFALLVAFLAGGAVAPVAGQEADDDPRRIALEGIQAEMLETLSRLQSTYGYLSGGMHRELRAYMIANGAPEASYAEHWSEQLSSYGFPDAHRYLSRHATFTGDHGYGHIERVIRAASSGGRLTDQHVAYYREGLVKWNAKVAEIESVYRDCAFPALAAAGHAHEQYSAAYADNERLFNRMQSIRLQSSRTDADRDELRRLEGGRPERNQRISGYYSAFELARAAGFACVDRLEQITAVDVFIAVELDRPLYTIGSMTIGVNPLVLRRHEFREETRQMAENLATHQRERAAAQAQIDELQREIDRLEILVEPNQRQIDEARAEGERLETEPRQIRAHRQNLVDLADVIERIDLELEILGEPINDAERAEHARLVSSRSDAVRQQEVVQQRLERLVEDDAARRERIEVVQADLGAQLDGRVQLAFQLDRLDRDLWRARWRAPAAGWELEGLEEEIARRRAVQGQLDATAEELRRQPSFFDMVAIYAGERRVTTARRAPYRPTLSNLQDQVDAAEAALTATKRDRDDVLGLLLDEHATSRDMLARVTTMTWSSMGLQVGTKSAIFLYDVAKEWREKGVYGALVEVGMKGLEQVMALARDGHLPTAAHVDEVALRREYQRTLDAAGADLKHEAARALVNRTLSSVKAPVTVDGQLRLERPVSSTIKNVARERVADYFVADRFRELTNGIEVEELLKQDVLSYIDSVQSLSDEAREALSQYRRLKAGETVMQAAASDLTRVGDSLKKFATDLPRGIATGAAKDAIELMARELGTALERSAWLSLFHQEERARQAFVAWQKASDAYYRALDAVDVARIAKQEFLAQYDSQSSFQFERNDPFYENERMSIRFADSIRGDLYKQPLTVTLGGRAAAREDSAYAVVARDLATGEGYKVLLSVVGGGDGQQR